MSASTAELLEQIMNLESLISDRRLAGDDISHLEDKLLELKEKFQLMNETLSDNRSLLKG